MTEGPVLTIADLRHALNRCLDSCERRLGSQVDLDASFYWLIEPGDAFLLENPPPVNVGDLFDDLAEIEILCRGADEEGEATRHSIGHLLGPLIRLATK